MLGIGADHPHHAFAANNLAVLTNSPDAGSDFHINLKTDPRIWGESSIIHFLTKLSSSA
jgi:hypothetical protein